MFIFGSVLPNSQPTLSLAGPSDLDINYLTGLNIYRGERLYSSFSNPYPPGRYFLQSIFFSIFGASVPASQMALLFMAHLIFPIILFLLAQKLFENLLFLKNETGKFLTSVGLAMLTVFISITFIRSAQEIHVFLALFFLAQLSTWQSSTQRQMVLGMLAGLVFLFRIDAGAMLLMSYLIATKKINKKKDYRYLILGFTIIWGPVILLLLLNGSITNFLYDTLVLGLLIQPRYMSLSVPDGDMKLIFISSLALLFSGSLAMQIESKKLSLPINSAVLTIAVFSLLAYVAALGRSDEAHLWYGLMWLSLIIPFILSQLSYNLYKHRELIRPLPIIIWGSAIAIFSYLTILIKQPIIYILSVSSIFILLRPKKFNPKPIIIAGIITAGYYFHSIAYINLRTVIPKFQSASQFRYHYLTSDGEEIAGLQLKSESATTLAEIKRKLTVEKAMSLFIFPNHTILYEYFQIKNPTRYLYLTGERTDKTEQEIISDLEKANTYHFLIFVESAEARGGEVWQYIKDNTEVLSTYKIEENSVQLRIRKQTVK